MGDIEVLPPEKKRGRGKPKGTKNKYTMSPAAMHQRVVAPLKTGDHSGIVKNVIKQYELDDEQTKLLAQRRQELWQQLKTPAIMLANEYINLDTIIKAKMMSGNDVTGKDMLAASRLLLDINKEMNRLTQLTAKDKFEGFTRSLNHDGDFEMDIEDEKE